MERESGISADPHDADDLDQQEARAWEGTHLPIFLLAVIGLAGLGGVMFSIFIFAPIWDRF